ncbi:MULTISPECIES: YbhB/YbcL family Raf kinase inhibitor-like protein [Microbacterium]|uniref:YbhB/YbcL family Raf kinase inhibitor-like protein n=1 Tax=Microbacterium TaxID=33882 RepID=UPI00217CF5C4|nr:MULTISPECIES: YbhB/YbcL family Raf kinase inhibitor-like protein [Microbacterium]UWF77408.1 YbhB/YbcL family Raf kinase inhibitor-like protein [Microbacterium neungamense]WCM55570.1 YbhB/YbcL family Raf kinase inhibitor-like protein [Microbacterium sp. EF45047]
MFSYDPYAALAELRPVPSLELTSPDFDADGPLPLFAWASARGGEDRHPALEWSEPPSGTRSIAVSCFDPDAPTGSGYWHWAAYNLPADLRSLPAGDGTAKSLPSGASVLPNEKRLERFIGAAPPEGTGVHRYFFVVDALDVDRLDLEAGATPAVLGFNRHFHTLARGVLVGTADPGER